MRNQESRPVEVPAALGPTETPGLWLAGARTAGTAEKQPVSFLLATGSPRTSEPGSPEEVPAHTDPSGGRGLPTGHSMAHTFSSQN